MPQFTVTDPQTKQSVTLTGESAPTEAELTEIFAKLPAAPAPPSTTTADNVFQQMRGQTLAQAPGEPQRTGAGAQIMPTVGGMVGGTLGGIPGAALGGAAGEAVRQTVLRGQGDTSIPSTPGGQAREIATSGAIQGAAQGAGDLLAAGAQKAAPWFMNRALNLTAKLSREFPELSQWMIDHALTVNKGGLTAARQMLGAATTQAKNALTTADAAGARVPITAATDGLRQTLEKVVNSSDIEGGLRALASAERTITAGRAADLSAVEAHALKQALQTQSQTLYKAVAMGQGRPNVSIKASALADMAASLNRSIGDITTAAGAPGYRAAMAESQGAIGAVRGIANAIRPGSNLYQAMVRPGVGAALGTLTGAETGGTKGAVAGALIGGALTSPAGMSRLAIVLSKPSVQMILRHSPRVATAVTNLLGAQEAR